jgi:hypothetical protein
MIDARGQSVITHFDNAPVDIQINPSLSNLLEATKRAERKLRYRLPNFKPPKHCFSIPICHFIIYCYIRPFL